MNATRTPQKGDRVLVTLKPFINSDKLISRQATFIKVDTWGHWVFEGARPNAVNVSPVHHIIDWEVI